MRVITIPVSVRRSADALKSDIPIIIQVAEDYGTYIEPLKWKKGDDEYNFRQLIETSVKNAYKNFPGLANLEYNVEHGKFIEAKSAKPVGDDRIRQLTADTGSGIGTSQVGRATAKRAAFFKSFLREVHGRGLGKLSWKPGQLERITKSLRRAFYSQSTINESRQQAGISVSAAEKALARAKLAIHDRVGLKLKVVADHSGLPDYMQEQIRSSKSVLGVVDENTQVVYIVAGNHAKIKDVHTTFAHEVVGHLGMDNVVADWNAVTERINWLVKLGHKESRSIMDEVNRRYKNASDDVRTREFIAVAVERQVKEGPIAALLRKIRKAIRAFLKSIGINRLFPAADIDIMIDKSRRYLHTGESETDIGTMQPNENLFSRTSKTTRELDSIPDNVQQKMIDDSLFSPNQEQTDKFINELDKWNNPISKRNGAPLVIGDTPAVLEKLKAPQLLIDDLFRVSLNSFYYHYENPSRYTREADENLPRFSICRHALHTPNLWPMDFSTLSRDTSC